MEKKLEQQSSGHPKSAFGAVLNILFTQDWFENHDLSVKFSYKI